MTSPYLTAKEAADYVRAPSLDAFDYWVKQRGVPCTRRGVVRLFRQDTLDAILKNDAYRTPRRSRQSKSKLVAV